MEVVVGGIYQHYKGNRYRVVGVARHSETLENLVIYQALYGEHLLWARPREMFCEKLGAAEKQWERFRFVGTDE